MESIVKKIPFSVFDDCEIGCIMVDDEPWFNSIDLCKALGFSSKQARNQALTSHVHDDDKTHLKCTPEHAELTVSQTMRI